MNIKIYRLSVFISSILLLISSSLQFDPVDNYLIDCGSDKDTTLGDRVFLADDLNSTFLTTPEKIFVSLNSTPSSYGSVLYQTARVLNGPSRFTFPIKIQGWHTIRIYIFPFATEKFNLSMSKFSVSSQNFTLVKNLNSLPMNSSVVEYSLNVKTDNLDLVFTPYVNSFAFLNALEVISLPDGLIPENVTTLSQRGHHVDLGSRAIEIVKRINMGNAIVPPENDTLWRFWEADGGYLTSQILVDFVPNGVVNYTRGHASEDIAPVSVYGSGTRLHGKEDPTIIANITWFFDVDPGFDYFVRYHFCDIITPNPENLLFFNVFLDSKDAEKDYNLSIYGAPFYMDVLVRSHDKDKLSVSIGSSSYSTIPDGILNGLEIMKVSNSKMSLDAEDGEISIDESTSKTNMWVIVGSCGGGLVFIVVFGLIIAIICRKRRRKVSMVHTTTQENIFDENENLTISRSKIGYRFPLTTLQEATENFSENLVVGVGGFGKVYLGAFRDGMKVAVKRGVSQSSQGVAEFKTEIEMLSQFRHRHLVSFIGYCDEKHEMIIIYEYMANGTLKDHLYGSDLPKLNWRKRLEICIGSARGLHYLHTGSVKAIIHRDVKTANILLDENFMAKVADFGLSKIGPGIDQTHVSTAVKGSFGYLDPEYLIMQQLTEKSDVYSFGVVMFEILCGRPVIDPSLPREMVNLVDWAIKSLRKGELEKLVDPHLIGDIKPESLAKFCEAAEKCLAEYGSDRPTMGDVLWNLEYALQLQGNEETSRLRDDEVVNDSHSRVSTLEFSVGSIGDLDGVSMSKVFSEMVNGEVK